MKFRSSALILMLLCYTAPAFTQNYYNNWYFGKNAGLTFNTNPPSMLGGGQIVTNEGVACISDNAGNLLFYTDGVTVWNRFHSVMTNGTGLSGNSTTTQSALIVPMPGSTTKYYLFTVGPTNSSGDLRYSIIDISLEGGIGAIEPAKKDIFVTGNQTEKLVAANATNCGVWVITHQRISNSFEARLVTASGIGSRVTSNAGTGHNGSNQSGVMKVSPNNHKLGLSTLGRIVELFDFDPATGIISNPIALPMAAPAQGYGVCFSPDNSRFYVTESLDPSSYDIYQYDISSGVAATMIATKTFVGRINTIGFIVGDMQIGPDGKIYCTKPGISALAVIHHPDLRAPMCTFDEAGQTIFGISEAGLPNEIRRTPIVSPELGNDTTLCPGTVLNLLAPPADTYLWSTGETSSSIHVTTDGKYWLRITSGGCELSDTINALFDIPQVNLGMDTTLCQGQTLVLDAPLNNAYTYNWSNGLTTPSINVKTPGQYSVTVSNGTCNGNGTINVAFESPPVVDLGNDITLCEGQQVLLSAGIANSYLWSTGATVPFNLILSVPFRAVTCHTNIPVDSLAPFNFPSHPLEISLDSKTFCPHLLYIVN